MMVSDVAVMSLLFIITIIEVLIIVIMYLINRNKYKK